MSASPFEKVLNILTPYVPIKRELGPYPDPKVPEHMFKLMKDRQEYDAFLRDPMASLQRAAISSDKLDVTMLVELARMLHAR